MSGPRQVEADSYWCLCKLLDGIQDHYTYAQPGIQRTVFHLKELVRWAHDWKQAQRCLLRMVAAPGAMPPHKWLQGTTISTWAVPLRLAFALSGSR